MCEVTLAIGNYLNGGTGKGAAWGFRLDALNKLGGTKSQDGTSTLLHYIARYMDQTYTEKVRAPPHNPHLPFQTKPRDVQSPHVQSSRVLS